MCPYRYHFLYGVHSGEREQPHPCMARKIRRFILMAGQDLTTPIRVILPARTLQKKVGALLCAL